MEDYFMRLSFSRLFGRSASTTRKVQQRPVTSFFRPQVEGLEERVVMSATALPPPVLAPALVATAAHNTNAQASVLPLSITGVSVQNGQLVANGLLGNQTFTAPLTLSNASSTSSTQAATQILNLHINPIHLNLLGLTVDTSAICLDITAQSGPGNLLGNLLSNISGLLNHGTSLGNILGGLTSTQQSTLTSGLSSLLNGALGAVNSQSALSGVTASPTGNILHLSLGPVNLNLLGLNVHLDNCANGPVTIDVGAQTGPGNLLGNLLSDVSHLLDTGANVRAVDNALSRFTQALEGQLASTIPLSITGVSIQNGQLVANGLLGTEPFTAPLTLANEVTGTTAPTSAAAAAATPVLELQLNPIHLNLLGLTVDTSAICLDITAQPGPGNLLGNLLSSISGLLNQGTSLGNILGGLTSTQQSTLTNGLGSMLNTVFADLTAPTAATSVTASPTGNILHLSLGPVNLNLLGLNVHLDNCANGPITVDIGAQPGPGNLLGNLLTGVTHLLDNTHGVQAVDMALAQLVNSVEGLI
jgi:hypothetical protein